ncbi:MAG: helix-turn-helix domain-containing protein [Capsulimonadales bacterium]|nr:helix-turn-helix domain-containing protein [Capsulimonadales bacterium]
MANPGKEKKGKENREDSALLRRLAEDFARLRLELEEIKRERFLPERSPSEKRIDFGPLTDTERDPQAVVAALRETDEAAVARLAYAFSSPQKVKIVRILLTEGELSSSGIGERTGLTTGSLYHHLRELTHAEVIEQAGRNLHRITPLGRRAAMALFPLTL